MRPVVDAPMAPGRGRRARCVARGGGSREVEAEANASRGGAARETLRPARAHLQAAPPNGERGDGRGPASAPAPRRREIEIRYEQRDGERVDIVVAACRRASPRAARSGRRYDASRSTGACRRPPARRRTRLIAGRFAGARRPATDRSVPRARERRWRQQRATAAARARRRAPPPARRCCTGERMARAPAAARRFVLPAPLPRGGIAHRRAALGRVTARAIMNARGRPATSWRADRRRADPRRAPQTRPACAASAARASTGAPAARVAQPPARGARIAKLPRRPLADFMPPPAPARRPSKTAARRRRKWVRAKCARSQPPPPWGTRRMRRSAARRHALSLGPTHNAERGYRAPRRKVRASALGAAVGNRLRPLTQRGRAVLVRVQRAGRGDAATMAMHRSASAAPAASSPSLGKLPLESNARQDRAQSALRSSSAVAQARRRPARGAPGDHKALAHPVVGARELR